MFSSVQHCISKAVQILVLAYDQHTHLCLEHVIEDRQLCMLQDGIHYHHQSVFTFYVMCPLTKSNGPFACV